MNLSEYQAWRRSPDQRLYIKQGDKWIPIGRCASFTITGPITGCDDENPLVTMTNPIYEFTMEGIFIPSEGENSTSDDIKLTFDDVFDDK